MASMYESKRSVVYYQIIREDGAIVYQVDASTVEEVEVIDDKDPSPLREVRALA